MRQAVESRRHELRLSPGDFASASGLTRTGLGHVRNGVRRAYQDDTINGVAAALRWKRDWYERLLRGEQPEPADATVDPDVREELDAIKVRLDGLEELLRSYLEGDR